MNAAARKALKVIACGVGLLGLLPAGYLGAQAILEVKAKRQWNVLVTAARAEGKELKKSYHPREIPSSENLLALPFFAGWIKDKNAWDEKIAGLTLVSCSKQKRELSPADQWLKNGTPFRTSAFDAWFGISLPEKLAEHRPLLDEIRSSIDTHPTLSLPIASDTLINTLALSFISKTSLLFRYSALSALEEGRGEAALADILTAWKLLNAFNEKITFNYLVKSGNLIPFQQVVATGLATHQWSEEEVAALQRELEVMSL